MYYPETTDDGGEAPSLPWLKLGIAALDAPNRRSISERGQPGVWGFVPM